MKEKKDDIYETDRILKKCLPIDEVLEIRTGLEVLADSDLYVSGDFALFRIELIL